MEGSIGNRYVPEKPILPLPGGMIYLGTDLSLKRQIILYGVDSPDETFAAHYIRQLREASQFTGENFMHILDLGIDTESNRLMAILKPCNGNPLIQEIGRRTAGFEESVRLVCELGVTMQKASAEGIPQFSVHADNLWLNEEKQIVVMNYWETGADRHRGVTGLCGLLYQLITGALTVPASWNSLILLLRESIAALPAQQKEGLLRIYDSAASGLLTLQEFTFQLRQLLSFRGSQATGSVKPDETAFQSRSAASLTKEIELERIEELKKAVAPASRARSDSKPHPQPVRIEEEDEDDAATMVLGAVKPDKKTFGTLAKRVLIYGSVFAGVIVLAGAILIGLLDNRNSNRGEEQTFAEQTPPTTQTQPQQTVTPKETKPDSAAVTPPAAGQPIPAPTLIGLTREQAEKQALASGLHYEFVIEANDQTANNTVFKQEPMPNTTVTTGGNIKFWVSK